MLEWIIHSLPDEELRKPPTVRAVGFLTDLLWKHRYRDWEVGALGHGLHALALYDERAFGGRPGNRNWAKGLASWSS